MNPNLNLLNRGGGGGFVWSQPTAGRWRVKGPPTAQERRLIERQVNLGMGIFKYLSGFMYYYMLLALQLQACHKSSKSCKCIMNNVAKVVAFTFVILHLQDSLDLHCKHVMIHWMLVVLHLQTCYTSINVSAAPAQRRAQALEHLNPGLDHLLRLLYYYYHYYYHYYYYIYIYICAYIVVFVKFWFIDVICIFITFSGMVRVLAVAIVACSVARDKTHRWPLAEVTLVFVPLGGSTGHREYLISHRRGVPPGVPTGTNTKGSSRRPLSQAPLVRPILPTNIIPTNIAWLKLSGRFPMDMRIPPLKIRIMLESNPLKSTMLVGGLGVGPSRPA